MWHRVVYIISLQQGVVLKSDIVLPCNTLTGQVVKYSSPSVSMSWLVVDHTTDRWCRLVNIHGTHRSTKAKAAAQWNPTDLRAI